MLFENISVSNVMPKSDLSNGPSSPQREARGLCSGLKAIQQYSTSSKGASITHSAGSELAQGIFWLAEFHLQMCWDFDNFPTEGHAVPLFGTNSILYAGC